MRKKVTGKRTTRFERTTHTWDESLDDDVVKSDNGTTILYGEVCTRAHYIANTTQQCNDFNPTRRETLSPWVDLRECCVAIVLECSLVVGSREVQGPRSPCSHSSRHEWTLLPWTNTWAESPSHQPRLSTESTRDSVGRLETRTCVCRVVCLQRVQCRGPDRVQSSRQIQRRWASTRGRLIVRDTRRWFGTGRGRRICTGCWVLPHWWHELEPSSTTTTTSSRTEVDFAFFVYYLNISDYM